MYCEKCGKKNIEHWNGAYNSIDGQKIMYERCPDECLHGKHELDESKVIGATFWSNGYYKCKFCNYIAKIFKYYGFD